MSVLTRLFGSKHDTEDLIEAVSRSFGAKKVAAIRALGAVENDERVPDFLIRYLTDRYRKYQQDSMTLQPELNAVVAAIEELGRFQVERARPVLNDWATYGFFTAIISAAQNALGKATPRPEHRHENLFYAVAFGDVEEVKRLLKEGADVDAVNVYGQTALDVARENGNEELIRLLT